MPGVNPFDDSLSSDRMAWALRGEEQPDESLSGWSEEGMLSWPAQWCRDRETAGRCPIGPDGYTEDGGRTSKGEGGPEREPFRGGRTWIPVASSVEQHQGFSADVNSRGQRERRDSKRKDAPNSGPPALNSGNPFLGDTRPADERHFDGREPHVYGDGGETNIGKNNLLFAGAEEDCRRCR
ncbi:hypothetical protein BSL78_25663 [Apostichopus japonicus]|uniref:Uncharacterized protein n=1 Tax=Stichopus japonicus TaxID=307972 RepID=A0A2G8JP86_STIJA|nr:hypothetical protein BSL78_25663 [Apostichopus japonicus]